MFSKHLNSRIIEILIAATTELFKCKTLTMKGKMPKTTLNGTNTFLAKWEGGLLIIFDVYFWLTIHDYWSDDDFSTFPT